MLEGTVLGIKIRASFSFFAIIAVVVVSDSNVPVLTALLCCLLHELGHIYFMCLYGVAPKSIMLYGGGFRIEPNQERLLSKRADVIILLAGCGVNLTLWLFTGIFLPETPMLRAFSDANLVYGIFNLLPFQYFDGGRIADKLFGESHKYATVTAYRFIRLGFSCAFALVLFYMVFFREMNYSLLLTLVYIVVSEIFF